MNKLNFHGSILSATYAPDLETEDEFEEKLLFRKNQYQDYLNEEEEKNEKTHKKKSYINIDYNSRKIVKPKRRTQINLN